MKRAVVVAVVFAFVVGSCGGGTEDTTSSADEGRFCELLVEFQQQNDIELGGDAAREAVAEGRAILGELVAVAPAELRAVMERNAVGGNAYLDLIEAADYDIEAIDFVALTALFEDPEFLADSEAVDVWMAANCP